MSSRNNELLNTLDHYTPNVDGFLMFAMVVAAIGMVVSQVIGAGSGDAPVTGQNILLDIVLAVIGLTIVLWRYFDVFENALPESVNDEIDFLAHTDFEKAICACQKSRLWTPRKILMAYVQLIDTYDAIDAARLEGGRA